MAVGLMGIGEFARKPLLSTKALRLYDELGLLRPASVDPDAGYRCYPECQLDAASLIAALRQLDVPLAQIKFMIGLPLTETARQVEASPQATRGRTPPPGPSTGQAGPAGQAGGVRAG